MVELLEAWLPIINALIEAPLAWQSPAALAAELGRDVEETTDLLCVLDEAGWIEVWEDESGPLVTLSVRAACRLRIHLVEVGPRETPRWAHVGDPIPPSPKARHVCGGERAARLDFLVDPAPPPDVAAEEAESAASKIAIRDAEGETGAVRVDGWPRPTLLIGQGLTPWPGPGAGRATLCPACLGRALRAHVYCLLCDRWGCDLRAGLTAQRPPRKRDPPTREGQARQDRRDAEHAKARRKAKRRAHLQAKADQERRRKPTPPIQDAPSSGTGKPASRKAR